MPTEDESDSATPSISTRTRNGNRTRQHPIATVQDGDDILQSPSYNPSPVDFEKDIEQTEQ